MRTKITFTSALVLAAATLAAPAFADGPRGDRHDRRDGYSYNDRGRDHGRNDRRDYRHDRRDDRRHVYQPPRRDHRGPVVYQQRPVYRPIYRSAPPRVVYAGSRPGWARGHYVSNYNRPVYVVNDYYGYGLRQPPRGYHWVRDDYGDYLMVAIATGLISDLIFNR